jgi:hypothetical protein
MRNMKDIVKAERARAIGQNNFTNMDNIHTYTICHPDLVIARVFLMHGEGFKFTGDMISASPPSSQGTSLDRRAKTMPLPPCSYKEQSLHRTSTNMWTRYAQPSCRLGNVDEIVQHRRKSRERDTDCWSSCRALLEMDRAHQCTLGHDHDRSGWSHHETRASHNHE